MLTIKTKLKQWPDDVWNVSFSGYVGSTTAEGQGRFIIQIYCKMIVNEILNTYEQ